MSGLLLFRRNRSGSTVIDRRSDGSTTSRSTPAIAGGATALVAAAVDDFVSTQAEGLFGLTNHTAIAITQRTGQGGNDFGAAAAVLANLIADFIGGFTTDAFVGIVQGVDKRGHDFRVADAIITIAQLADGGTTLTGIAGRLRFVDQLGDLAGIRTARLGGTGSGTAGSRGSGTSRGTTRGGTRGLAALAEES